MFLTSIFTNKFFRKVSSIVEPAKSEVPSGGQFKIAEFEKAIPAAHLLNAMPFASGNSGEIDKFYISNIKITKD